MCVDYGTGVSFVDYVISLLPSSPFATVFAQIGNLPYLGYLNWFVPVGQILGVMTVWLAAIATYYLYSVFMRWIKLIGD